MGCAVFVNAHDGVVAAIGVEIEAVDLFMVNIGDVVYCYKSADFGVVVTGFQVIQARFVITFLNKADLFMMSITYNLTIVKILLK